ncbi:MAG: hypothetical protein ACLGG7_11260 [Bacteriovoracia bacterium]
MKTVMLLLLVSSATVHAQANKAIKEIFKDKTSIENPFDLRDPFRAPLMKRGADEKNKERAKNESGIYTNINPMGSIELEGLTIVGVIIGKERYALAKIGTRKDTIKLIEGTRIGRDGAELKAIHPGGVILVEKLVNVYGEEEYLETVIPITK